MEGAQAPPAGRRTTVSLRRLAPRALRRHESVDDAFERFYRKHVAEVYQYALALLGNSADAEDVTQQTFLNAYRAFQRGGRPTKPHNWLIKIAHNVCRMRWRQSGRRPQEVPLDAAPEPAAPDDEKPSLDVVLSELARLPLNQRAAIVMREVEDRSYAEIAEVLGVTVPAVEALLFRARTKLRTRRKALAGTLGVAPVPASLASFGGSGGLIAAGGAALGSEVALKVAAVVATSAVAGGLGYKTVNAVATPDPSPARAAEVRHVAQPLAPVSLQPPQGVSRSRRVDLASFRHARPAVQRQGQGRLRKVPTNDRPSQSAPPAAEPAQAPPSESPALAQTAPAAAAQTVGGVVATVPPVPPVSTPPVVVSTPVVPVTVTVPPVTVPPPPGLK
jgi:RNA polymerase sigma-70 factor, ECF subfamily